MDWEFSTPLPQGSLAVNAIAVDGAHVIAMTVNRNRPGGFHDLDIARQSTTGWQLIGSFTMDSTPPYEVKMENGPGMVWIAWRGRTAGGLSELKLRQVGATLGPVLVVPNTSGETSKFDLAVDQANLPYLATNRDNQEELPFPNPRIRIHRRLPSGAWEIQDAVIRSSPANRTFGSLALNARADRLDLFFTLDGYSTVSGVERRTISLFHYESSSAADFVNPGNVPVTIAEGFSTDFNFPPAIAEISSGSSTGIFPAVAYADQAARVVKVAHFSPNSVWVTETLPYPPGTSFDGFIASPCLQVGADGADFLVSWRSSITGSLAYSKRSNGVWVTSLVGTVKVFRTSLALDRNSNPHMATNLIAAPNFPLAIRPYDITDEDNDGFIHLLEIAFGMDPNIPSNDRAPLLGKRTIGGMTYPTITYFRQTGGTPTTSNPHLTSDFIYTVETSEDLVRWRIKPADLAHFESFSIFGVGSQSTWRSVKSLEENPRQFLRIRVDRR